MCVIHEMARELQHQERAVVERTNNSNDTYEDEDYCDWCKQPAHQCNCDGGTGPNWI